MSCLSATLSVIDARCDTSIGGIKRLLIANRDDIVSVDIASGASNANKLITSITLAEGKVFKQWLFRRNTGSYTATLASDPAIGSNIITTEVSLQFSRAEAQKRLAIQNAIDNAAAVVIVEDMLGNFVYLGKDSSVDIVAATMQSGAQTSDLNGFNLTFKDEALELPYFVEPSIIPDLIRGQVVYRHIYFTYPAAAAPVTDMPANITVEDGQSVTIPNDHTPTSSASGYGAFQYYKDVVNPSVHYTKGQTFTPTSDLTLEAVFAEVVPTYTVTYKASQKVSGNDVVETYNAGDTITIKSGSSLGFRSSTGGEEDLVNDVAVLLPNVIPMSVGNSFSMPAHNVTIYIIASDTPRIDIIYRRGVNITGGSVDSAIYSGRIPRLSNLQLATPSQLGVTAASGKTLQSYYTLGGSYIELGLSAMEDYNTPTAFSADSYANIDATISATDSSHYVISYADGETGGAYYIPSASEISRGSSVTITSTPIAPGYTFSNWKDQNGNFYSNNVPFTPTSDLVLEAQWSSSGGISD